MVKATKIQSGRARDSCSRSIVSVFNEELASARMMFGPGAVAPQKRKSPMQAQDSRMETEQRRSRTAGTV